MEVIGKTETLNKQTIISLINNPELIDQNHQEELKKLSNQFPYSGTLQMLYAKALHADGNVMFDDQLKLAAISCTDRKKLYQLIHQSKLRKLIEEVTETALIEAPDQKEVEVVEEESLPKANEEVLETKETKEEPISNQTKTIDKLEEDVLIEAINSSIQLDINEYNFEPEVSSEDKGEDSSEGVEETQHPSPTSFTGWFGKPESTPTPKKTQSKDTSSLINSFIERQDERLTPKTEFFSPANLGKMSLVDNEEFVTETLAKVYAAQGNFEKAIRIYEQLSLNNPEKKTFFASRIRFLREKLENKND